MVWDRRSEGGGEVGIEGGRDVRRSEGEVRSEGGKRRGAKE